MTTFRSVPTTQVRRETYVENVPVTTYEQITVPRTVYQPQVRQRDVAFTVNQTVAETQTRYVPQAYSPQPIGVAHNLPVGPAPCTTCNQNQAMGFHAAQAAPAYIPPGVAYAPRAYGSPSMYGSSAGPVPTPIELPPSTVHQHSPSATLSTPQPYAESQWQSVPQRQAQDNTNIQQMGGFYPSYSPQPVRTAPSLFQPAPTAANVWQSRWMR